MQSEDTTFIKTINYVLLVKYIIVRTYFYAPDDVQTYEKLCAIFNMKYEFIVFTNIISGMLRQ